MTTRWSDEAYSHFYERSAAEKHLVNTKPQGNKRVGRSSGLTKEQLNKFQEAFAEWSSLGQGGIRPTDFRRFLMQLGLDLSRAQTASLWRDYVQEEGSQYLEYAGALDAYLQVTGGSMRFERADEPRPGAATAAPGTATAAASTNALGSAGRPHDAAATAAVNLRSGTARGPERDGAIEGLGMILGAAREFLLAEGLPSADVETFLRPFSRQGAVPQTALFDFLAQHAGAEAMPSSPSGQLLTAAA